MRAIICGANGAMGKLIRDILGSEAIGLVSLDGENGVPRTFAELGDTNADIIIDFSHHTAIADVVSYAKAHNCALVVGTTGHTAEEKALIAEAARWFPEADIEIVEVHHNRKVDAPSGTAHMLFNAIAQVRPEATENCGRAGEGKRTKNEIGVSSLRMGNVVGIHEVHICTANQTLTLRHEAGNRGMLAEGAVEAARFMAGKPKGLYNMDDLLEGK